VDPHRNPYTPGAGAKPRALVGRDRNIDEFRVALGRAAGSHHARSFIFDGLRGVGKTVLLAELDIVARESGWVTSGIVECNEDDQLAPLIARLSHRILRKLSRGKRASRSLQRALGVLSAFNLTLDESGRWRLNIDVDPLRGVADSGDREADIVELMAEVGRVASEHGAGVAVLLDEMQFLGRADLSVLAAAMHRISQETMPVLLAGAGLPQLPLMLKEAKPYTERLFDYRTIGGLTPGQARQALVIPAQREGARFSQAAVDLILEESAGYPYFIQQWGETVWDEAPGSPIGIGDSRAAEELVNDELDRRFFRDRYEKATEAERIYMAAMADMGDGPRTSSDIAEYLRMTPGQLSVRRAGLLAKGLIYNPRRTQLDFTVPKFAAFMRRVHPFDPTEVPTRGRRRRR
jgi:AAA ATPase domain